MGKKDKNRKKGKGAEKTQMKTDKKLVAKQRILLKRIGEDDVQEIVSKLEAAEQLLKEATETMSISPSARSSFSLCAHPDKEELILFGGEFYNGQKVCVYNDLFFYNIPKKEWKLVKSPCGPAPRSSHQMVTVAADGGQLWLFGGEHASPSQLQFYHFKDLWVFRLANKKWEKVNAVNGPSARSGHRMTAVKKKLFIFGGFHDNNTAYQYFNDVHVFSLESYTWLNIEVTGAVSPSPRSGCCMAAVTNGRILIWGGYTKSKVKKEVDRGITHTDMFALVPFESDSANKFKWTSIKPSGIRPHPRSGIAYTTASNGKAYCFGGVMDADEDDENISGQFGNDLYCLDLASTTFRFIDFTRKERNQKSSEDKTQEVEMADATGPSRSEPTTIINDGIYRITIGGSSTSSSSESKISSLFAKLNPKPKNGPHPRMNAGLAVCKGNLYLYGGIYEEEKKQNTLVDFHVLDLHKLDCWKSITSNSESHEWVDSSSEGSSSSSKGNSDSDNVDSDEDSEMDTE